MVVLKEFENMFWGLTLEHGKRYIQTVEQSFHLSMAALDVKHSQEKDGPVAVMISQNGSDYVACTLSHKILFQQPLDLNFSTGEEITFFLTGQGKVHLTGYQIEDEDEDDAMDSGDFGESSDEEAPELVPEKGSKRKKAPKDTLAKKLKWVSPGDEDSDEDSEEDSEDEEDSDMYEEGLDGKGFLDDEAEDDEEMEEESDEDASDEEYDDTPEKSGKKKNLAKNKPKPEVKQKKDGKDKQTPEVSGGDTPGMDAAGDAQESAKKKKKKRKKKKNKPAEEAVADKSSEKQSSQEQKGQTPSSSKTPNKQNQSSMQKSSQEQTTKTPSSGKTPKKQVLAGGTIMEELKIGDGPVAKNGKMVHVYYVGRLAKNNQQFDSCSGGKPFRFRLGKSEVIKGWDLGLAGMRVGGKRRLTVPPQQGYGSQRQGPIPPNSTLVFEIELKLVS